MDYQLILAFLGGVGVLLFLILVWKVNAFISLLVGSIVVGLVSGMNPSEVMDNVVKGMGDTLGFVATVVGLGSIIGAILEATGSTEGLARSMLSRMGESRSRLALSISGFMIAIPVFFDVAFIILVPMVYALRQKTGKSLLYFALPLLASLAVTHAFIPPTPGPIAVADILGADLGWIIFFGLIVGIPATIVGGILFGGFISSRISTIGEENLLIDSDLRISTSNPPAHLIAFVILLPILLILGNTLSKSIIGTQEEGIWMWIQFLGHPIMALIITTAVAMVTLGIKYGATLDQLKDVAGRSLGPAGIIILITGAGGVFKQMLVTSGVGSMLAQQAASWQLSYIWLAFILALIVRLVQGSATVAMITAAGIVAPILAGTQVTSPQLALIVLSIAAGASGFSHVNDSGFWLVNKYLHLSEIDTIKSWTAMTGVISITSIVLISIIMLLI
ncbi:MAG: gluconate transporter [Saprospiraceae bacterium]|nr:gluconate transporter [Saprospiraceae bacterium]